MPPDTVYVGRPTKWGNPARIINVSDEMTWDDQHAWRVKSDVGEYVSGYLDTKAEARSIATQWYREAIVEPALRLVPNWLDELRGKNLACWCPLDQPCHADVLLELVNSEVVT